MNPRSGDALHVSEEEPAPKRARGCLPLLAIIAVILVVAAPRSAQVYPSGPRTTATTTPELSGARDSDVTARDTAPLRSAGTEGTVGTATGGAGGRKPPQPGSLSIVEAYRRQGLPVDA